MISRRGVRVAYPLGAKAAPRRVRETSVNIHQRLQDTKTRTLAHYKLADDQLELRYGPDKWSVRFILHHLADAETVFAIEPENR